MGNLEVARRRLLECVAFACAVGLRVEASGMDGRMVGMGYVSVNEGKSRVINETLAIWVARGWSGWLEYVGYLCVFVCAGARGIEVSERGG